MTALDWKAMHMAAMRAPRGAEIPHVLMFKAITAALERWPGDGYLEPHLVDMVNGARGMLNMDSGRLDCGTLDGHYCNALRALGVEP